MGRSGSQSVFVCFMDEHGKVTVPLGSIVDGVMKARGQRTGGLTESEQERKRERTGGLKEK